MKGVLKVKVGAEKKGGVKYHRGRQKIQGGYKHWGGAKNTEGTPGGVNMGGLKNTPGG